MAPVDPARHPQRRAGAPPASGRCPCGLPLPYAECCGPLLAGGAAPTAERLMRSRYSAFALGDAAHLLATWHPSTRPLAVPLDPQQHWTGLQVLRATGGNVLDSEGSVEFRASSTRGGRIGVLTEDSYFARDGSRWAYVGPVAPGRGGLVPRRPAGWTS